MIAGRGTSMRRTAGMIAVLALGVSACSSDGDSGAATTTDPTGGGVTADEAAGSDDGASDPGTGGTEPRPESAVVEIWLPSSLALDTFVEAAFERAAFDVEVHLASVSYDGTGSAATDALVAGDYVLVPATVGDELVDDGTAVFVGRVFEDAGEVSATQLGVWLLAPAAIDAAGTAMASDAGVVSTGLRARRSGGTAGIDGPPPPPDAQEVIDFIGAEEQAYMDSLIQSGTFKAAGEVVRTAALEYGERVGGSVALRGVAKAAGPVASVLDFLKTTHDFTVAAMEMIDAESAAAISLYDTGMTATTIISDATVRLGEIEAGLIEGTVSAADAQELVETLQRAITRASSLATDSALDLEELDGEVGAAQILQLRRRRLDEFFRRAAEVIDEIDARPAPDDIDPGPGQDRIIRVVHPSQLGLVADILFDTGAGNESTHSNGHQTVVSDGDTDLIGIGQFWWSPGGGGPGLDELLPCGLHGDAHTLCGDRPYDGDHLVVLAHLAAPVDFGTDRIHQYAFVFDRDGDPADDYLAAGAYPKDTWDHSDLRYELAISGGRSQVNVTEGADFAALSSGARVHVDGDLIMGFIPQDEVGTVGGAVPMRATTFWHLGDYGEGPDEAFNIDLFPVVGEPFWAPTDVVSVSGPGASPVEPPFDATAMAVFDEHRDRVAAGFAGWTSTVPVEEDPSVLADHPECFAADYFSDNRTVLASERESYEIDGVSIQVRYEAHESESAAEGGAWLTSSSVGEACRRALVESTGVDVAAVEHVADDSVTRVSFELDGAGAGLYIDVYSATIGTTAVRVTTTGPMVESVADAIVAALDDG
jgi:hypothetical protein